MDNNTKTKNLEEIEALDDDEEIQENQFLTFSIAQEIYAINILNVVEIIRMIKITPLPETYTFIKGIINLRGKIIPVMDIRLRFSLPEKESDDRTCIIVVHIKDVEIGLIVDAVSEVTEIPTANIENMPDINKNSSQKYIQGLGKTGDQVKIILDLDRLLFEEQIEKLKNSEHI